MPESVNKSLSAESFEALLEALGLSDEDSSAVPVKPIPSYIPSEFVSPPRPITPFSTMDYPLAEETRYSIFGQDYLSDFDIWADIEDEDSDCDLEDALPSRPGSSFEIFEVMIDPSDPSYTLSQPGPFPLSPNPDLCPLYETTSHPSLRLQCNTILSPLSSKSSPARPSAISTFNSTSTSNVSSKATATTSHSTPPTPASASASSPCCSGVDDATDTIHIKAALNASIVMMRVPRAITFAELRQRLYDKFVRQEGMHLSHAFSVVNVLPPSVGTSPSSSVESSPTSSPVENPKLKTPLWLERSPVRRPRGISFAQRTEMRFIDREADWRRVVALECEEGNKIALRILDTPP